MAKDADREPSVPEEIDYDGLRLDALREVGMIGAGHATTALAEMTGRAIMIDVSDARIVKVSHVAKALGLGDDEVAVVALRTLGDLTGKALFVLPASDARRLADMLLGLTLGTTKIFSVMERSSIEEAGNVVAAAYLNALSDFLGMMSMPTVPALFLGAADWVLEDQLGDGVPTDIVVCISTRFSFRDTLPGISGHYLFLPNAPALRAILSALQLD